MALCLTAVGVGLLVGLAHGMLAQRGALEPSTFALFGLVVILLGQGTTPFFYPFGVGLLLGLAYDRLEEEWYGSVMTWLKELQCVEKVPWASCGSFRDA